MRALSKAVYRICYPGWRALRKEFIQEIITHSCVKIDERENRINVYDTVATKKTAGLLDWIGKCRLQCSDMVEYKGQTGKIISKGQHDIVIAFDYDADYATYRF